MIDDIQSWLPHVFNKYIRTLERILAELGIAEVARFLDPDESNREGGGFILQGFHKRAIGGIVFQPQIVHPEHDFVPLRAGAAENAGTTAARIPDNIRRTTFSK